MTDDKKPLKVVFAPGCFDELNLTQEELDELKAQLEKMFLEGGAASQGIPLSELPPEERARLDHAFHRAICEASHNPILVNTLQSLTDLLLSSVFASVNNLYHRVPVKKQIDRQHARLYNAVTGRLPEQAHKAASEHLRNVIEYLHEIENEEQRLVRATLRLEGWK